MYAATTTIFFFALLVSVAFNVRQQSLLRNERRHNKRLRGQVHNLEQLVYQNRSNPLIGSAPQPTVQEKKALDGLNVAVKMGLMSAEEAQKMAQSLGLSTYTPKGITTGDDVCPECGNTFDVQDDYVCASCRAKMGS